MRYANTFIYVFQFEYVFMYMFSYGNELYQNNVRLLPGLLARFLYTLHIIDTPYTPEEIEEGEKVILSGALKTLDELNDPNKKTQRKKVLRAVKEKLKQQTGCVWQTREGKDDAFYMCITHKQIVRMVDGVKPTHD